ncbi:glycosyltransferase family 4 protein [Candidatus Woesebacteria bacterium]|nr:glycosyltransferase family 4 protein [Candidatus Woesebacteria bacterium]
MKTRIGIDCRLSGFKHAGIGRYVEELVKRVTRNQTFDFVLFFHDQEQAQEFEFGSNVAIVYSPFRHYSLSEQLNMPAIFGKAKLDLLHVPHFNVPLLYDGKTVVTIHDLLWHESKGSTVTTLSPMKYALKYQAYRIIVARAIRQANQIIVPARTVKDSIVRLFPTLESKKVSITYEGVDPSWFSQSLPKTKREKVLFYTGSLYPHKNVLAIVQALEKLPEYSLVVSSSRSVFVDQFMQDVKNMKMEHRVQYVGRLSDEKLKSWYKRASALIQPSLSEGFGLTGVEAMAAGIRVIASNIPIFKEIYQDHAAYFNPHDPSDLARVVESLDKKVVDLSLAQEFVRRYSWDTMAEETITIYEKALQKRS